MLFTDNTNAIIYELLIPKIIIYGAQLDAEDSHLKFIIIEFLQIILRSNVDDLHSKLIADGLELAVRIKDNEMAFSHDERCIQLFIDILFSSSCRLLNIKVKR